jgi:hypothetical protein
MSPTILLGLERLILTFFIQSIHVQAIADRSFCADSEQSRHSVSVSSRQSLPLLHLASIVHRSERLPYRIEDNSAN